MAHFFLSNKNHRTRCGWFPTFILSLFWMLSVVMGSSSSNSIRMRGTGSDDDGENHVDVSILLNNGVTRQIEEGAFTYYEYPSKNTNELNPTAADQMENHTDPSSSFSMKASSCQTILLLGVGAAMDSTEYSKLAMNIVMEDPTMVAIILDDNPHQIPKQDAEKFAKLVHAIVSQLGTYIPSCAGTAAAATAAAATVVTSHPSSPPPITIIIGGHSASGQGAFEALPLLLDTSSTWYTPFLQGFVGLAPYKILSSDGSSSSSSSSSRSRIDLPALYWGFSTMTCAVQVERAADQAYHSSNPLHRVLFQVHTEASSHNPITGGPHCVFSDHGCAASLHMCNPPEFQWIKSAVATSIAVFVQAIQQMHDTNGRSFSKSTFEKVLPAGTKLFVNQEELPETSSSLYHYKDEEEQLQEQQAKE
jgi:hypothetical protein